MSSFEKMISLIIPFYNSESTLPRCLASVEGQSIDKNSIEVILVNDGSDDGSAEIAKDFASRNMFATIITQPHGGSAAARNSGITAARGKYIAFLDSDDTLSADALKNSFDFFEKNGERTDIAALKLVPYTNSGRKKCEFKYEKRASDIYDLNEESNKFICPNGVNIIVKNRGDENILFDSSEECDLKAAEFCIQCVRDKMTVGYVDGAEYCKFNNPSGESKALKCSIYFDVFIGKWEDIFAGFDSVSDYVKSLFVEDLLGRISGDYLLPYHIEGEAYREEIGRIEKLLETVDDDIIINFPNAPLMNKYFLVSMKYKGELEAVTGDNLRLVHGDEVLYEAESVKLVLTKLKARERGVDVCGYISSPIFD